MATIGYKWLFASLIISLFYVKPSGFGDAAVLHKWKKGSLHPFHVSTTEINHNAKDKSLEITCRIFTDDFEAILGKNYKTAVDLTHPKDRTATDKIVKDYILKHLQLGIDGNILSLSFLGFEIDNDAVNAYFEADNISSVKKVEVADSILYDQFTDQIGIVHVIVNGKRKSTELNYPNARVVFLF